MQLVFLVDLLVFFTLCSFFQLEDMFEFNVVFYNLLIVLLFWVKGRKYVSISVLKEHVCSPLIFFKACFIILKFLHNVIIILPFLLNVWSHNFYFLFRSINFIIGHIYCSKNIWFSWSFYLISWSHFINFWYNCCRFCSFSSCNAFAFDPKIILLNLFRVFSFLIVNMLFHWISILKQL
jgi:hypothetical protein